jgi:hypothetical protein
MAAMQMSARSALIAVAVLASLSAGCGSTSVTGVPTTTRAGRRGPVAGSHALAGASAERLLRLLVLPAGSARLPAQQVPGTLQQPALSILGPGNLLDQDQLYRLPTTVPRAITFLRAHKPRGTVVNTAASWGNPDAVTITVIAFTEPNAPAGINQINLIETLAPGPDGSSLLRADAQVVWYPPRSAAEYLIATMFRSVRITMTRMTMSRSDATQNAAGGQRLIRPLAAILDSMHATSALNASCPIPPLSYKLVFAPAVPAQPAIIVTSEYCGKDQVSVGGRGQPELSDTGALSALVARLVRANEPVYGS